MTPQRTLTYLFYLGLFILLLRLTNAATVNFAAPDVIAVESTKSPEGATPKRDAMKRGFEECRTQLSWMCLKIELVKLMERLAEQDELTLMTGISMVRNRNATDIKSNDLMAEVARNYPSDPNSRLNGYIVNKLSNFLQSHYLRFKLIDASTVAEARSAVETGRKGKFGKKGGMEAILAAGLMMKGTLMAIGMGAIALLAGKALMTALMALTLSGVIGLKSLAGGGGKSTTYEIVAKPVYTSSHAHSVSYDEGHGYGHGGGGGSGGGHHGGGGGGSGHGGSGYGGYSRSLNIKVPNSVQ